MERDLTSMVSPDVALDVAAITTDTTTVGNIIDTKGFESVDFAVIAGLLTDGAYAITLKDGDAANLSDGAAVNADFIVGSLPTFALTDDDTVKHFGYVGKKRFIEMSVVSTATSTGGTLGAIATKGHAEQRPTV